MSPNPTANNLDANPDPFAELAASQEARAAFEDTTGVLVLRRYQNLVNAIIAVNTCDPSQLTLMAAWSRADDMIKYQNAPTRAPRLRNVPNPDHNSALRRTLICDRMMAWERRLEMIDEIECVSAEIAALRAVVVEYRVVKAELGLVEAWILEIEGRCDIVADQEIKQGVLQTVLAQMLAAMEQKVDTLADKFVQTLRSLGLDTELASDLAGANNSEDERYSDDDDNDTMIDWKGGESDVEDDACDVFSSDPGGLSDGEDIIVDEIETERKRIETFKF